MQASGQLIDEIVKEKSVEELNAQLVSLVGENGAEMLKSAFRSRRSISGPELAEVTFITPRIYNAKPFNSSKYQMIVGDNANFTVFHITLYV